MIDDRSTGVMCDLWRARQAEVNLVFKQLLFDLEAEVFGYFKDWAASTTLDKMYKIVIEKKRGVGHFVPGRRRYEVRGYITVCVL